MRSGDLFGMSIANLFRRKLRTLLTVLGVLIGTASIVVMISLGLGLKKSSMEQIEQYGGLTTITVYPDEGDGNDEKKMKRLDDMAVQTIAQLDHVQFASPVLQISAIAKQGVYQAYLTIQGMTSEALAKLNLEIGQGSLPEKGKELQLFFGNRVVADFYHAKTGEYISDDGTESNIDLANSPIFYIFDTDAYYDSQNNSEGQRTAPPKKYILPVSGIMAGGSDTYSNYSYTVFADIDVLKEFLKKEFKKKAIPGQPVNKNGKPYKELYYNQIYVRVDQMEHMKTVQKNITELGFEVSSNAEWLEQTQQQLSLIQMVLGGIGAVSLFVAAIGIANTMMMSIYERTKEIGILKVLGCALVNIQQMFLIEAGLIGFLGGVAGLLMSYEISFGINLLAKGSDYQGISFIPFWLAALALLFIKPMPFVDHVDHFVIIIGNIKCVRQTLSYFPSSAAKLSADCNNSHNDSFLFNKFFLP